MSAAHQPQARPKSARGSTLKNFHSLRWRRPLKIRAIMDVTRLQHAVPYVEMFPAHRAVWEDLK
jgi:hypothetical protein